MELGISREYEWYKPKYPKGNELLPDETAIAIELKVLDYKDKTALGKKVKSWVTLAGGQRSSVKKQMEESNLTEVHQKTFREHTGKVKNLEINGVVVKSGAELLDMDGVPMELISDISGALYADEGVDEEVKN